MIILHMVKNRRCTGGCGEFRRVDARTGLCMYCLAPIIEMADRKNKLDTTIQMLLARRVKINIAPTTKAWWVKNGTLDMRVKNVFVTLLRKIKEKLEEFNEIGAKA